MDKKIKKDLENLNNTMSEVDLRMYIERYILVIKKTTSYQVHTGNSQTFIIFEKNSRKFHEVKLLQKLFFIKRQ